MEDETLEEEGVSKIEKHTKTNLESWYCRYYHAKVDYHKKSSDATKGW